MNTRWAAYPFSSNLPDPGIELGSPTLQADSLPAELLGKPKQHPNGTIKAKTERFNCMLSTMETF